MSKNYLFEGYMLKSFCFELYFAFNKFVTAILPKSFVLLRNYSILTWLRKLELSDWTHDWLIGISLDGPEHIHNRYRFDKGHKGTHKRVEENAIMLQQEGVSANAMCCVTSYSVQFPDELYNYYKSIGYNFMQFIPIVETDKDDPTKAAPF